MLRVREIVKIMEDIAPPRLAMEGDKIGLQIGSLEQEVNKVVLCLDVTEEVVAYATRENAELIISHHPLIFDSLSSLLDSNPIQRIVANATRANISVYVAHTNLDNADRGINDYLVSLCKGRKKEPLLHGASRVGLVCNIDTIPLTELASSISASLGERLYVVGESMGINRLAVISGGGGGDTAYVDTAKDMGASCLLTGDIKHHVCKHALSQGICLIDASHFITEYSYLPTLKNLILEQVKKLKNTLVVEIAKESNARRIV